jgi:glucose-6-phosphate 1-dehydrogenase
MTMHDDRHDSEPDLKPPCHGILVIYGASGDLARSKLLPSLYNLARDGLVPEDFAVLGNGRTAMSEDEFRRQASDALRTQLGDDLDEQVSNRLLSQVHYEPGDATDPQLYERLGRRLDELRGKLRGCPQPDDASGDGNPVADNEVHYLALPPSLFGTIVEHLCAAGILRRDWRARSRIVIEKPFGHDLDSARALNHRLLEHLDENQVYRIDHYLGKDTVQNLMVLRFGNTIFEPIWNRRYVDHVQITVAEDGGIDGRGAYFDQAGTLRDMVPNHLMQLLSLIAMEPPSSFDAEAVRTAKAEVLNAVTAQTAAAAAERAVRGQYRAGRVGDDAAEVRGYRDEKDVAEDSAIETYVALPLTIDNWRWADVPFYLRTGKRLAARQTEILVQFRRIPAALFRAGAGGADGLPTPNRLLIRIQPREAILLRFEAKRPGPAMRIGDAELEFCYRDHFGAAPATGYETLLYDALHGDATLFQRADSIEAGWRIVDPILRAWAEADAAGRTPETYPAGSWGPEAADALPARGGHTWHNET